MVEMDCRRTEEVANIGWWWRMIVWVGLPEGVQGAEDSVSMPSLSRESMEEEHEGRTLDAIRHGCENVVV